MLEVIVSFLYIAVFCMCLGSGVLKLISSKISLPDISVTGRIVTGVIALSTAVGWISIFCRIGVAVHIVMLIIAAACAWYSRAEMREAYKRMTKELKWPEYLVGTCFVLIIAYAASRGDFHTDTGIYHAAAIRLYEEYGIIKGMVNIQPHYGYNSSYLGFAAFFTLSRILPSALHTTTGFLETLFVLYALFRLKDIRRHTTHYADGVRIVLILYVFMNLTGTMSPATDYAVNIMVGYFLCAWLEASETGTGKNGSADEMQTDLYALLSVFGLFLTTMKLSAAMCVLVVILPLYRLIKEKAFGRIVAFVGMGLSAFVFYPVRNVILTGWLFYPFESIDLFNVEWKMPLENSLLDSSQIKVWGRCLFDVEKVDWPMSKWLPIWWEWQEHYDQMLLYGVVLGIVLIVLTILVNKKIRPAIFFFYLTIFANLTVWFVSAPFVRYGLIFLLAVPLCAVAGVIDASALSGVSKASGSSAGPVNAPGSRIPGPKRFILYIMCGICILIAICFCSRIDHYVMDDLVFIKHNLTKPYYVLQQPFDDAPMGVEYLGETKVPIYYADNDEEKNSYYTPPSTCYKWMLDRAEPIGDDVKDGFKPR